ncbi:hypothetical protein HYH03_000035 [Edaphochlamys debaryana]|uniref:Uncharacterized protein n=1 Tax=Edaphochlamys debaryana TaxID=47281 RepID=A0A835YF37_9CHLO|nr:hypothetical protein HYH03_000035 [Edaphochlamys debaryana]|eukprot:KAG2501528.1 hypothetical protein HYH03_000035 [Edaphochlamys debaryana]
MPQVGEKPSAAPALAETVAVPGAARQHPQPAVCQARWAGAGASAAAEVEPASCQALLRLGADLGPVEVVASQCHCRVELCQPAEGRGRPAEAQDCCHQPLPAAALAEPAEAAALLSVEAAAVGSAREAWGLRKAGAQALTVVQEVAGRVVASPWGLGGGGWAAVAGERVRWDCCRSAVPLVGGRENRREAKVEVAGEAATPRAKAEG